MDITRDLQLKMKVLKQKNNYSKNRKIKKIKNRNNKLNLQFLMLIVDLYYFKLKKQKKMIKIFYKPKIKEKDLKVVKRLKIMGIRDS